MSIQIKKHDRRLNVYLCGREKVVTKKMSRLYGVSMSRLCWSGIHHLRHVSSAVWGTNWYESNINFTDFINNNLALEWDPLDLPSPFNVTVNLTEDEYWQVVSLAERYGLSCSALFRIGLAVVDINCQLMCEMLRQSDYLQAAVKKNGLPVPPLLAMSFAY